MGEEHRSQYLCRNTDNDEVLNFDSYCFSLLGKESESHKEDPLNCNLHYDKRKKYNHSRYTHTLTHKYDFPFCMYKTEGSH